MSLGHLSKLGLIENPEGFRPLKFFQYEVRQSILKDVLKALATDQSFHYQYKLNNLPQFEYLCHTMSESFFLDLKDFELTRNTAKIIISWFISKTDLPPCLKPAMSRSRGKDGELVESTDNLTQHGSNAELNASPTKESSHTLLKSFKKPNLDGEQALRLVNQLLLHFSSVFEMDDQYDDVGSSFLENYQLLLTTVIGFYVQFARTWAFKMVAPRNPPRDVLDQSPSRLLFKITIGLVDYCLQKQKPKEQHQAVWTRILHKACSALLSVIFSSKDLSDESWDELQLFFKQWLNHPNIAKVWSSVIYSLTEHIQFLSEKRLQSSKLMDIVKINLPGNEVLGVSLTEEEFFEFWRRFISLGNTILVPEVLSYLNPESFYIIYLGLNQLVSKLIDMENNNIMQLKDQVIISSNSILKLFGGWLMTGACFEDIKDIMHFKGRAEALSCLCRIFTNDISEGLMRGKDDEYNGSFNKEEIACLLAIINKRLNSDFFSSSKLLFHIPQLLSLELQGIAHLLPNILQCCSLFIPEIDGADNLLLEEQQAVQMAAIENLKYLVPYYNKYTHLFAAQPKLQFMTLKLNSDLLKSFKQSDSLTGVFGDLYRLLQAALLCKLTIEDDIDVVCIINSLTILSIENIEHKTCTMTAMTYLDKIYDLSSVMPTTPVGFKETKDNPLPVSVHCPLINNLFYAIHALLPYCQTQIQITMRLLQLLPIFVNNYKSYKPCIFTLLYTLRKSIYNQPMINNQCMVELYRLYNSYSDQLSDLQLNWDKLSDQDRDFKPYLVYICELLYIIHVQCYTMHYFEHGHVDEELPELQGINVDELINNNQQWLKARQIYQVKGAIVKGKQPVSVTTLFKELEGIETSGINALKYYHDKEAIYCIHKLNKTDAKLIIRNRNGLFEYLIKEHGKMIPKLGRHLQGNTSECRTPLLQLNLLDHLKTLTITPDLLTDIREIDNTNYLQTMTIYVYNAHQESKKRNKQFLNSIGQITGEGDYVVSISEDEQYRYHFYSQYARMIETEGITNLDGFYSLDKINAFVYFESFYSNNDVFEDVVELCTDEKQVGLIIIFKQNKTKGLMKCLIYKRNVLKKMNTITPLKDAEGNKEANSLYKSVYNSAPLYHGCIVNVENVGGLLKSTLSMFEMQDKNTLDNDRLKKLKTVGTKYTSDVGESGVLQIADLLTC